MGLKPPPTRGTMCACRGGPPRGLLLKWLMPINHKPTQPLARSRASAPTPEREPPRQRTFSEELQSLAAQFADRSARLEEVLAATQGRGFDLLLLLIALPFITPIPLLGLSTPFGFVIFLIGARLALGRRPWLPQRLLERELPPRFITKVLGGAGRVVRWLEVLLRPRLGFLHEQVVYRRITGTFIMLSGLLLLLPLPIPLTNTFPALTVVLLAAAALERDGVFFLVGSAAFAMTLVYFGLLALGGRRLIEDLMHRVLGG